MNGKTVILSNPDERGYHLELQPVIHYTTAQELLQRFYRHNLGIERPLGACLKEEGWWIVFYRSYLAIVDKISNTSFGPHRAKLFYRSEQHSEACWIATLQIENTFFESESLPLSVLAATNRQLWYQTEKEKLTPIPK